MSFVIDLERVIDAPAATVWAAITDLPRYGEWNPFCIECRSTLVPGDPIHMRVRLLSRPQAQSEVIFEHLPMSHLCYGLDGGASGAIKSNRCHRIEALPDGRTRYRSHFELSGWLMPLVRLMFRKPLQRGFTGMTDGIVAESLRRAAQTARKSPASA